MLIQNYEWKGVNWNSAIKITGVSSSNGSEDGKFNITLTINRYTDSTCKYDIEQIDKTFENIEDGTIDGINILNLSVFDDLLLSSNEFSNATKAE